MQDLKRRTITIELFSLDAHILLSGDGYYYIVPHNALNSVTVL